MIRPYSVNPSMLWLLAHLTRDVCWSMERCFPAERWDRKKEAK
jgi:hypothetical protein